MTTLLVIHEDESIKVSAMPENVTSITLRCLNKNIYAIDSINNGEDDIYVSAKMYPGENVELVVLEERRVFEKVKEVMIDAHDMANLDFITSRNMKEITISWNNTTKAADNSVPQPVRGP